MKPLRTTPISALAFLVSAALGLVSGLLPAPSEAAGARAVPANVIEASTSRVRFVVDVPRPTFAPSSLSGFEKISLAGFEPTGEAGEPPALSRRFLVALPPTGTYAVSARVLASEPLGAHRLEPMATPFLIDSKDEFGASLGERPEWKQSVYSAWIAPDVIVHDEPAYIRRQRVLPLGVHPIFYDPSTTEVVVATRIEVEIRFAGGTPSRVAPGVAPESAAWDAMFGRLFVNPREARAWRVPKPAVAQTSATVARAAPGAVKLRVRDTGVHKVSAASLVASGFPAGQPVTNLRLYRRTYNDTTLTSGETDVPLYVREEAGGVAGVLDGNDLVVFYGLRVRDDALQGDAREQFSSVNTYWLEPGAGTPMTTRTPAPGFVTADTTTAFFPATAHFEVDTYFRDATPPNVNDVYYVSSGRQPGPIDLPFTLNAVRPGGALGISAELHGWVYSTALRTIRISLVNSNGETVLEPTYILNNKNRQTFTSSPIPAASLAVGANTFRIARPSGSTRPMVDAAINFVDVSYGSLYRARGNTLRFNTASLAGDTSITVTGLSSNANFELFDVTAPTTPVRCAIDFSHFTNVPGGFAFSVRESIPSRREFVLVPTSRMIDIPASDIALDVASSIIGGPAESGIDVLVVSNALYLGQMQGWARYRRAQGYRVLLVDVEDVFDEFNGGVFHARAIQRFTRHFFERADASALVLVGDASEDHKLVHADSGPNFVPTFTRIDAVAGLGLDEVVTTDKRFVKLPGPGGTVDVFPDMIVGRLPVGDTSELERVLAKTYGFETPNASEFWRKRMIIVADDEYSEGASVFGTVAQLCYNGEIGFQNGQETVAQIIENSLPGGYDVLRFYLKDYTSAFYPCTPPNCNGNDCATIGAAIAFTRQGATVRLMDEMNQGATLVTIQSHMNRSTVTHERLLTTISGAVNPPNKDHLRFENFNRPWIIFGMGCHFSDYAVFREDSDIWIPSNNPNGDAFAEQLLFQNNGRAAVGTYGSSGFEYLGANNSYMNTMARVWFYEAPYDTMLEHTQAEWKFGQLMFLVESQLAGFSNQRDPVERYHILGDPLLNIDAGPPAFDVTVNGLPVSDGDDVTSLGETDTLSVVAVVTDENAIRDFELEIAGIDMSDSLTIQALTDPTLPRARQYRLSFAHTLQPENYDIVLRALQAPDTLAGNYHIVAEFTLRVESSIEVAVNGHVVTSGASVPAKGDYRIDLSFPVYVPGSEIGVFIDQSPVSPFTLSNPSPEDSLAWIITFQKTLSVGTHELRLVAGPTIEFLYQLVVGDDTGLSELLNYPNPFRDAGTHIMFRNDVEITDGSIDIYTVSGKRVRRLDIPVSARFPGNNAVFWDGRDGSGDEIANGTYLYVIKVEQRGGSATVRGKVSKVQ
ncbi:MAG: C25 family cysteine peptidase [Candidatus Latescibacteria bacterium]|nr:C25 family cysteine peptidase [Candidatus Latescibacterota bacterium]